MSVGELRVVILSPEEASYQAAELWRDDELLGITSKTAARWCCASSPAGTAARPVTIDALALQRAVAEALERLAQY